MKKRKILIGVILLLVTFGISVVIVNWFVVKELERELKKDETGTFFQYKELKVNVLTGNASIFDLTYKENGFLIEAEVIHLKDLSYFNYFSKGDFVIGELEINNPVVTYNKEEEEQDPVISREEGFEEEITVKKLNINNGIFKTAKRDSGKGNFHMIFKNIQFRELFSNPNLRRQNLPFEYENVKITSDSLFLDLNEEHNLVVKEITMDEGFLQINDLQIIPKFSRAEFDRKISYEKDRVELAINSMRTRNIEWELINDSLKFTSPSVAIDTANLQVYRNKLLPDDTRIKPLYSKMLRELGIKLKLDTVMISNSHITYYEKVKEDRPPGQLNFSNVQAEILNLSNIAKDSGGNKKTTFNAKALFMDATPLTMELEFDVHDPQDQFNVSGRLGTIRANAINPFLQPAMNVMVEGTINSMAYTFYGNRARAKGEMQLSYEDFKVSILNKDGEKKKSLLSGIVNLFIKNKALNDNILQEDLVVERNQTKSLWNFLWLCIREGALKAFL